MYKILIADDEEGIRKIVEKYAKLEEYEVGEAKDGMEALDAIKNGNYDLAVVDIMMPELDGFSVVREVRKVSKIPIILLSARGESYDRIHGFESGADDYVTKPFSPKELMLRISAILGRVKGDNGVTGDIYETDHLKVDFKARKVYVDGKQIDLSPKEYDLLFYMVRNRGIALMREKLLSDVWGYDFFGDDRTLDTHIKLLRKSLGVCSSYIVTLRSAGYRFETTETQS